jgi:hypothetical protein
MKVEIIAELEMKSRQRCFRDACVGAWVSRVQALNPQPVRGACVGGKRGPYRALFWRTNARAPTQAGG